MTSSTQIVVPSENSHYKVEDRVYEALKTVLPTLSQQLQIGYASVGGTDPSIGLIVALSEDGFFEEVEKLEECCLKKMIVVRPWSHKTPAWASLLPEDRVAFEEFCISSTPDLVSILKAISSAKNGAVDKVAQERRKQVLAARNCYKKRIASISHGSSSDVVNCIYAPARVLLLSQNTQDVEEAWKAWWKADTTIAARGMLTKNNSEIQDGDDPLTKEFLGAWNRAKEWIIASNGKPPLFRGAPVSQIERLMSLLTNIRQRAGITVHSQNSSPPKAPDTFTVSKNGIASELESYRLLVVDDHATSWEPILKVVAKKVAEDSRLGGRPVSVEFATSVQGDVLKRIPECDLILLDIYLPDNSGRSGINLLKKIRDRAGLLPVILWTSSMERELPAEASLASGFLFKKTATIESMAEMISSWLAIGSSTRRWSLLNPFFDNALRAPEERELALGFTHWCLKYLDAFHAVDPLVFKFFNDHGGRHIWGVLEILQKLVRPFLLAEQEDVGVAAAPTLFSADASERRQEILLLYLATLCHELGMFPREEEGSVEGCCRVAIRAIRSLHSIRSMLLIARGKEWGGAQFYGELDALLVKLPDGQRNDLTVLVGYHQKTLTSSVTDNRVEFRFPDSETLICKTDLKRANDGKGQPCKLLDTLIEGYDDTAESLQTSLGKRAAGQDVRLCQLSALLRFADALDIDYTRIPAGFLLKHPDRNVFDDVENFKRQIVRDVRIDGGKVSLVLGWPKDSLDELKKLDNVWLAAYRTKKYTKKDIEDVEREQWSEVWTKLKGKARLSEKDPYWWVVKQFKKPPRNRKALHLCVAATALRVCSEITEEYAAIADARLNEHIILDQVIWVPVNNGDLSIFDFDPANRERERKCSYCKWCKGTQEDALEIERKFLVSAAPILKECEKIEMQQGYAAVADDGTEVRVRSEDKRYVLTIKSGNGLKRQQYEVDLNEYQFRAIWPSTEGRRIEKTRFLIPDPNKERGLTIELDKYKGKLEGLITAEVEFKTVEQSKAFEPADLEWLGRDITQEEPYKNQSLALKGLPKNK